MTGTVGGLLKPSFPDGGRECLYTEDENVSIRRTRESLDGGQESLYTADGNVSIEVRSKAVSDTSGDCFALPR
jgi:hypothetical protein